MYTVSSLTIYFDRRPQFAHLRSIVIEAAMQNANADGCIMAGDDWSWMDQFLFTDFQQECARDPLGMFGPDMQRLDISIPFLPIVVANFPNAKDGDVVLEGQVMLQTGGIPGAYSWDVEVIMVEGNPTTYWHPDLLRGWGGKVQIVMRVREKGLRELEVRQRP